MSVFNSFSAPLGSKDQEIMNPELIEAEAGAD
jgi:hypothetical protein